MFNGRVLNIQTNQLRGRSLQMVYRGSQSSFYELLQKDHSLTIYHRNIQSMTIELNKRK